ncbi:MAG: glycosyltransferase family 4 protein [Candidatus Aminicenantes bacterium]|nr:MAG: glycosyltransferase family 4 protein [Candidatus Aminicenantes bacterium]
MSLFHIDAGKEWRGGQRQSFFLVRELAKKGYPVQFIVQPGSPLYQSATEAKLPVISQKIRAEIDPAAVLRIALAMKRKKCVLAHFHDAHSAAVGSMAASLAKVPIRVITRRVDFPLKKNLFSRRKYNKDVDAVIAISEGVKKVLVEGGLERGLIEVIPSGIDFSPFEKTYSSDYLRQELSFSSDDYLVGIVAHLADHKGHKYLIQATKILKEYSPKIKVIIVGEGPLRMELDKQTKESEVEDMVFFLGFRKDIPQILFSLDLFVLSSYLEGLGSSILDAMACRLPVVATRTGGIPELVAHRKTGLLVPPTDPSALARAILKLYNDRELAFRLGQKGYDVVHKKFSVESRADKVILLYKRLALKKGISPTLVLPEKKKIDEYRD